MVLLRGLISNTLLEHLPGVLEKNPNMVIALTKKMFEIRVENELIIPYGDIDIRDLRICYGLTDRYKGEQAGNTWVISEGAAFKAVNAAVESVKTEEVLSTPPETRKPEVIPENRQNKTKKSTKKSAKNGAKSGLTTEKPQNKEKDEVLNSYRSYLEKQDLSPRAVSAKVNRLQAVLDLVNDPEVNPKNLIEINYQDLFKEDGKDYWKSVLEEAAEVVA